MKKLQGERCIENPTEYIIFVVVDSVKSGDNHNI